MISSGIPAIDRYYTALDRAAGGDYQAAHDALLECVVAEPGNAQFVQAFLENLARWFEEKKSPGDVDARPEDRGTDTPGTPSEVLSELPAQLATPPWNIAVLRSLASACSELGYGDAELLYLARAASVAPRDPAAARQQARSLQHWDRIDEAIAAWQRVQDLAPDDPDAAHQIAALVTERSRRRLSISDTTPAATKTITTRSNTVYANERALRELMKEGSEAKRSPLQQLEFAVRDWPSNPDLYLKLASMYLEKGREYDAEKLLTRAKELMDDARISELWEDVTMTRLQHKVAAAQKQLQTDRSEAAILALGDAQKARDRFQTDVFVARSKREPENAALKYELGLRWKQAGKMQDAYQCFVAALRDSAVKGPAALEMADCLEQVGQVLEALQYYRVAADSSSPQQSNCRSRALYRCGVLAAESKLHRLSERYLSRLLQLEPTNVEANTLLKTVREASRT